MRGLDSLMYIKFVKYMALLFVSYPTNSQSVFLNSHPSTLIMQIFAPIGLAVLIPLDVTGGFLDDQNGVAALSMANLRDHSGRIWVHALYAVFCTILTLYFLYRLYAMVCFEEKGDGRGERSMAKANI